MIRNADFTSQFSVVFIVELSYCDSIDGYLPVPLQQHKTLKCSANREYNDICRTVYIPQV